MGIADTLKNLFGRVRNEGESFGHSIGQDFSRTTDNDPTNDLPNASGRQGRQGQVADDVRHGRDKLNERNRGQGSY